MFRRLLLITCCLGVTLHGGTQTTQKGEVLPAVRASENPTKLVFPFVTDSAGFDTEITISNTSSDTLGSSPVAGTCTLTFYGGTSATATTNSIAAGTSLAFRVSQGGGGVASRTNFQGYVTASCAFPLARGRAKIFGSSILAWSQDAQVITIPRSTSTPQGLLFPYVTNTAGFDTGIEIANTSLDPFGTTPTTGSCTLNFYGTNARSAVSTGTITPGTVYVNLTSTLAPNFTGYVIANCNFTGATGHAFVSDTGARNQAYAETPELITTPRGNTSSVPLLFSRVDNTSGNDTALALMNTSSDPFGTTASDGTCTLNFYGSNAPSPVTTGTIAAGSFYTNLASVLAPNFSGYVIAVCTFPHARGFSLMASTGFTTDGDSETAEVLTTPRSTTPAPLLFSAVSDRNGADTYFVISNTSQDPIGTATSSGTCTITYFGDMASLGTLPSPQTSSSIAAGGQLTFSLTSGNPAQGIAAVPKGFRGYVIVSCGFALARGISIGLQAPAVLSVTSSHTGTFTQGQNGATYTLVVTNQGGETVGTVTVTETVPAGMTLVSLSGGGWTCASGSNKCTRSDVLATGAGWPQITATVNVSGTAGTPLLNQVSVSGGGSTTNTKTDSTVVIPPGTVTVTGVNPSSGTAASQNFALQYSDTAGAGNLATAWVWFNPTFSGGANSCMLYYDNVSGLLYLLNDAGTAWIQGGYPGNSVGVLQNSSCSVSLPTSSVSTSGNTLTLNLAMSFKPAFVGLKNIYMYAADLGGTNSGWQTAGTWTAAAPGLVTAVSVTPNAGSGVSQTFALAFTDSLGATNLTTAWVWFTPTFAGSAANSCMVYYDRVANTINLLNDAGTTWMPGTAGGAGTLQNTQCAVSLATSSAVASGNTLTVNLAMTFKAFTGVKSIYMYARDTGGGNSGWQTLGNWSASGATVTADSVTPNSGSGTSQTFALQYSDTAGASSLSTAWVWFNATFSGAANSCMAYYDRAANTLFLLNDAGSGYLSGTPGAAATLQNSQCAVNLASTSAVPSGNTLTLNLAMTFKGPFAGLKNIYMYAADVFGASSNWQTKGTFTAAGVAVTVTSVTPSSGSGPAQSFALQYADTAGASNFATVWVWFNATFSNAGNSCMLYYDRAASKLYLLNDAGSAWLPGTPGSGSTLQNTQCAVNLSATSAVPTGNSLTLNLAMTFKTPYSGAKNIYMYAADLTGANSGWQVGGTWTAAAASVTADSVTPGSGSGSAQSFALQYSDTAGASNFSTVWVWFNATFSNAPNSCMLYYDRAAATLYLLNDAGAAWLPGTPGAAGTLQNSQCAVDLGTTTAVPSGNTLTLTLPVTFKAPFAGPKNVYMYGADAGGSNSGWQTRGTWTAQ